MRLKRILKINGLMMIICVLCVSLFLPTGTAFAAKKDKVKDATSSFEIPESVDFDLSKNQKQEFTFIDEKGNEVTIGAEPVIEENQGGVSTFATYPISSGYSTWKIYHYSGAINMSYRIKIYRSGSTTKITDAYDLSINLIGYTESNRSFTYSSSKAEYTGTAQLFNSLASISIRLTAKVSGSTLTTSAKS